MQSEEPEVRDRSIGVLVNCYLTFVDKEEAKIEDKAKLEQVKKDPSKVSVPIGNDPETITKEFISS